LDFLAHDFQKSINQTESKMVHHLRENYEENRKGQTEIIDTLRKVDENLRKVDENESRIAQLLL
jgi:tRNA A-37 threonylcarbamoyl transferase component Bud32